ncbi:Fc receptor, IgE, high affinity I, gamma polypeptide like isoform X1 [Centroberyx affinis]|uniref:Fc receptor, IgE, high affinity I, gamma polypeptide like isoform X1 n=1 Tax=Centroberyx affinis TaxID=166261 RepID=UPI003A5B954E
MLRGSLIATLLMMNLTCAEAFEDKNICYILDGILIMYGIILTVLYCRLRMHPVSIQPAAQPQKQPYEGGIYAVRLLILMFKKTFKMAHGGKARACRTAEGSDTPQYGHL